MGHVVGLLFLVLNFVSGVAAFAAADLPRLVFVGEDHEASRSQFLKARMFGLAKRGVFPLLSEVTDEGPLFTWDPLVLEHKNIFGLESEIPYAIYQPVLLADNLYIGHGRYSVRYDFCRNVSLTPRLARALETAKVGLANVPAAIRALADLPVPEDNENAHRAACNAWSERSVRRDHLSSLIAILEAQYRALESTLRAEGVWPAAAAHVVAPKTFQETELDRFADALMRAVVEDARDDDFARTIAARLEALAGQSARLVVLTGQAHMGPVLRRLEAWRADLQIERYVTSERASAARLTRWLKRETMALRVNEAHAR